MARSLNKVMVLGNLGADPETRFTNSGTPIARFRIATTRRWQDSRTEDWREETDWHDVVCFGRNAEVAGEYLQKGRQCFVEGELRTNSWERDGERHFRTEIHARNLILLGGPGGQSRGGGYGGSPPRGGGGGGGSSSGSNNDSYSRRGDRVGSGTSRGSQSDSQGSPSDSFDDLDDDIPF